MDNLVEYFRKKIYVISTLICFLHLFIAIIALCLSGSGVIFIFTLPIFFPIYAGIIFFWALFRYNNIVLPLFLFDILFFGGILYGLICMNQDVSGKAYNPSLLFFIGIIMLGGVMYLVKNQSLWRENTLKMFVGICILYFILSMIFPVGYNYYIQNISFNLLFLIALLSFVPYLVW